MTENNDTTPLLEYPRGSPKAMKRKFWITLLGSLGTAAVGTGAFGFLMVGGVTASTRGATRSTRLVWEQRQDQVEQAIAAQASPEQVCDEPSDR